MQQPSLDEQLEAALRLHQEGRLEPAANLYRQILQKNPDEVDTLHLLGAVTAQQGNAQEGLNLIDRAIALDPSCADFHNNRGLILANLGRIDDAIAAHRKSIELNPDFAEAYNNLGNALVKTGRLDEAESAFRRTLALRPDCANAQSNLGVVLHRQDKFNEAIAAYRAALRLQPHNAEVQSNLGAVLREIGEMDQAIEAFRAAIAIDETCVDAHANLGAALHDLGHFDQAVAEFQIAISQRPDHFEAKMNLGVAFRALGQTDHAIEAFRQSLALRPDFYEAHLNLGQALWDVHDFDGAIASFRNAITLRPENPDAHFHLAGLLLLTGNFPDGWREYEWRLLKPEIGSPESRYHKPRWIGQDLAGKRILLHCEQGAGDAIQFCRLCSLLTQRGAHIMLGCSPPLFRLFHSLSGVSQVVTKTPAADEFDYHCDLLSLPFLLGLRIETIPATIPYLYPERDLIDHWRTRLAPLGNRRKIGLAWTGNPKQANSRKKSIPLASFAPLAELHDTVFVSLQKEDPLKQSPPPGLELIDYTSELTDFADTAALIANLDLVITMDTSVAHLAGAMGRPVWLLLRFVPDWRWLINRDDSPWYPSMRLFRQTRPADWETPIRAVVDSLASTASFEKA